MKKTIGIVGAGVLGRLTALRLAAEGCDVTIFDRDLAKGHAGTSAMAAGLLSPYCESETAESLIFELGVASLEMWPMLLHTLVGSVYFQREGSLVVAHANDRTELERLKTMMRLKLDGCGLRVVSASEIAELEPALDRRFLNGLYFPFEGQIDPHGFLATSLEALSRLGVRAVFETDVLSIKTNSVETAGDDHRLSFQFDHVIDCRGVDARQDLPSLRPVRGEIILVHAPDVSLRRPVRLMHPRFPLYIAPRPEQRFMIGATQIESDDPHPITVRSALELLSAAFAVSAGFAEARILAMRVGLRPAFPDNLPRLIINNGLIRANGLYRHGFLLAPKISELVTNVVLGRKLDPMCASLIQTENYAN